MDCYRVPKRRVSVRISLRNQAEKAGSIFVGDSAKSHSGPERPSDVMNDDAVFFAVEADGAVEFLPRHAVAFLAVATPLEFELGTGADDDTIQLAITLDDGRCFEGMVRYRLPDFARRLQDFLNLGDRFLRLERADDVLLVNKGRIVSAREIRPGEERRGAD